MGADLFGVVNTNAGVNGERGQFVEGFGDGRFASVDPGGVPERCHVVGGGADAFDGHVAREFPQLEVVTFRLHLASGGALGNQVGFQDFAGADGGFGRPLEDGLERVFEIFRRSRFDVVRSEERLDHVGFPARMDAVLPGFLPVVVACGVEGDVQIAGVVAQGCAATGRPHPVVGPHGFGHLIHQVVDGPRRVADDVPANGNLFGKSDGRVGAERGVVEVLGQAVGFEVVAGGFVEVGESPQVGVYAGQRHGVGKFTETGHFGWQVAGGVARDLDVLHPGPSAGDAGDCEEREESADPKTRRADHELAPGWWSRG